MRRLATLNTIKSIRNALDDDENRIVLHPKAFRWLLKHEIDPDQLIEALKFHIDDGAKVFAKAYPNSRMTGVEGNLYLPHDAADSAYFEMQRTPDGSLVLDVWSLRVHSHDTGYPSVPR